MALGALWMAGNAISNWMSGPDDKAAPSPEPQTVAQVHNAPAPAPARSARADRLAQQVAALAGTQHRPAPGMLAAAPAPEPTVKAVIEPSLSDGHNDLIRKFQRTGLRDFESAFQALSLQAEGLELTPYNAGENRSATNATIGVGYHIPSNLRDLGRKKVLEEFRQAGISDQDGMALVSGDPRQMAQVEITPKQAFSLLAVTMPRYKGAVINRLGSDNWRRLGQIAGPEGQAGVVWSAYNGAFWQHANDTIAAIRSGDRLAVAESIGGTARINGRRQENHNLSLARAAVASRETFNYAIGYGNREGANDRVNALARNRVLPPRPGHTPDRPLRSDPSTAHTSMDAQVATEPGRYPTRFGGQPAYDPAHDPAKQPDLVGVGRAAAVEYVPVHPTSTRINPQAFEQAHPAPSTAPEPTRPAMRP